MQSSFITWSDCVTAKQFSFHVAYVTAANRGYHFMSYLRDLYGHNMTFCGDTWPEFCCCWDKRWDV